MKSVEKLKVLQKNTANIRNICILAHVDHGKTTLADSLIASNGIISQRMAGKLRYMDSREDEQLRGITMKSSAVSLQYHRDGSDYLINLIDSPGHIDFSSEVSTAVRLCDGAVVLVDVVEGVCPQTHAVLRQAWLENIKPVLMFNKIDRLITELKMTPLEAHTHLLQLLEKVNAISGELFTRGVFAKYSVQDTVSAPTEDSSAQDQPAYDWDEEEDESLLYFCPDQGNVVFGSAIDGWGFRVSQFAELFARKVGVSAQVLNKTLWGDFYLDVKTKTIKKGAQKRGKKPLFVQLVLDNLWTFYDVLLVSRSCLCVCSDKERLEKMMKSLDLKPVTRCSDPRAHLQALFNQWLPLSHAVLGMVSEKLPSPVNNTEERVERLLCSNTKRFTSLPPATQLLKHDFLASSCSEMAPVVLFVSKMFSVDAATLPHNKPKTMSAEEMAARRQAILAKRAAANEQPSVAAAANEQLSDTAAANEQLPMNISTNEQPVSSTAVSDQSSAHSGEVFIAFARIFSGTIKKNQKIFVLGPKYDPSRAADSTSEKQKNSSVTHHMDHVTEVTIQDLYLLMGRDLVQVDEVPAGNVLGIGGLGEVIFKSATLSSTLSCPAFTDMYQEASPIVRVAVQPTNAGELKRLVEGLRLLNQSDPCVEVSVEENGEYIIMAAGEVHLQKCLDDLRDKFAKVDISVSAPNVPFRETIVPPPKLDMVNEVIQDSAPNKPENTVTRNKTNESGNDEEEQEEEQDEQQERGVAQGLTPDKKCQVQIRAVPLPTQVTRLLEENSSLLRALERLSSEVRQDSETSGGVSSEMERSVEELREKLEQAFLEADKDFWNDVMDCIWSFGPKKNRTNILVNKVPGYRRASMWSCVSKGGGREDDTRGGEGEVLRSYESSIVNGFQLATQAGPLCEEPMTGVCFILEQCNINPQSSATKNIKTSSDTTTVNNDNVPESSDTNSVTDGLQNLSLNGSSVESELMEERLLSRGVDEGGLVRGQLSGQLISCVKETCRRAFLTQPQRLVWAMYSCVIFTTAEALGKMYGVLGKREGRVLQEDLKDGWSVFSVTALLPAVESFGFADEIRKKTSGLASPQLRFSHWEPIDIDPHWVPTTEEEYLHYGEKADAENIARKHMNAVRRRKGLKVKEKIVEFGEKQRTLKKNK